MQNSPIYFVSDPPPVTAEILYNSVAEGRRQWVRDLVGPDGVVVFTLEEALALEIKCPDPTPFPEMDFRFIAAGKGECYDVGLKQNVPVMISTFVYEVSPPESEHVLIAIGANCTYNGSYKNPDEPVGEGEIAFYRSADGCDLRSVGGLFDKVGLDPNGEIVSLESTRTDLKGIRAEWVFTKLGLASYWEPRVGTENGEQVNYHVLAFPGQGPRKIPQIPADFDVKAMGCTQGDYVEALITQGHVPLQIGETSKYTLVSC